MIYNIVDRRSRRYRWLKINAIIEATSHDNGCEDSDEASESDDDVTYLERQSISLHEAIVWAEQEPSPVTLFLYDQGKGTT